MAPSAAARDLPSSPSPGALLGQRHLAAGGKDLVASQKLGRLSLFRLHGSGCPFPNVESKLHGVHLPLVLHGLRGGVLKVLVGSLVSLGRDWAIHTVRRWPHAHVEL